MIIFNGKMLDISHFSNSECQIRDFCQDIKDTDNLVELIFETDKKGYNVNEDLINLLFVSNELKNVCRNARLVLWCMPYQRMDRKIESNVFTLEPICKYINWLKFNEVIVVDPHSSVTLRLLKNSRAIYPLLQWFSEIKEEINFTREDYIVFSDKNTAKKYKDYNLAENICFCNNKNNIIESLNRTQLAISSIIRKVIIVEDICSKGDTLFECCSLLKRLGAKQIYVVVTHCEMTALLNPIFFDPYQVEKVFTSKSNMSMKHYKIKYLDISFD